ncbi:hypothetical protein CKO44_24305 [Rubrivivax gelatinosus]|uniref:hypothetical protein n=1 Tax=Rubrivivax gelatinosus TaxID=28068 RepID=UPI0019079D1B|nr:hypothetical protein [Rubrivivax gelatinosus]MBK1616568.1 hypothetical protein [Rubrivivax gelatinosus]
MQIQNSLAGVAATRGTRREADSSLGTALAAAAGGAGAAADAAPAAGSSDRAAGADTKPLRGAREQAQGPSNSTVAGAQRTLNYLDELRQRLQALKERLSLRIAQGKETRDAADADGAGLQAALDEAASSWRSRGDATSGFLDDTLAFDAEGQARVRFRVRGLNAAALDSGRAETLSFQSRSSRRSISVVLADGEGAGSALRQLDRALTPVGVRAGLDASGEPVFSVAEADWAGLQGSLSVTGGGIRFPAGQAQPARLQRQSEALAPEGWGVDDIEQSRQTLREVARALERVQRVAESLRRLLASQAQTSVDPAWAQSFVGDLSATLNGASYETYVAMAPALGGINRSRVVELLSLR